MKKKTFNAQSEITWRGDRMREDASHYSVSTKSDSTLNTQRPTLNAQRQKKKHYDLEDRLLAGQLLRCGTSPYGNHGEVEAAESRKDFIHKLRICLKELKETRRWLRLAARSAMLPVARLAPILT